MKNLINEYYDTNIKNRNKLYSKLLEIFNDKASLYNKPNFAGEHIDGTIYIDDGSLDDKVLTLAFDYCIEGHYTKEDFLSFDNDYVTKHNGLLVQKNFTNIMKY